MDGGTERDDTLDGRTARRDRNREAVLDAVLELFAEGRLEPSPDEVARRSGVSLRSVYRYVRDADDLIQQAVERHLEKVRPLAELKNIGEGELVARIEQFVNVRVRLYNAVAPTARAARRIEGGNKRVRDQRDEGRRLLREQFEDHFAPELAALGRQQRTSVIAVGDSLTQVDSIDYLRELRSMSSREAGRHLRYGLTVLLMKPAGAGDFETASD